MFAKQGRSGIGALVAGICLGAIAAVATLSSAQAQDNSGSGALVPPVTIKDLMVGAIEPASNALWAIALEENAPKTEVDWKAVESEAIQLLAATSATSLGGSGQGEQAMARQEEWQKYSRQMADISLQILEAARNRNYEAALDAGNFLIEPCGACHSAFPVDSR